MEHIPVAGPWITQKEIDYVADAAAHAWYERSPICIMNGSKRRFQSISAQNMRWHCRPAHLQSTCHFFHWGIGKGDEVIVPDLIRYSPAPITYVGASPIFADCDEKTWCISSDAFQECITSRDKSGHPC